MAPGVEVGKPTGGGFTGLTVGVGIAAVVVTDVVAVSAVVPETATVAVNGWVMAAGVAWTATGDISTAGEEGRVGGRLTAGAAAGWGVEPGPPITIEHPAPANSTVSNRPKAIHLNV